MQARKSIVMQWNYILLVVHYSVLVMLNARLWDFLFLGWTLLNLLLAFICTKYDHYLCIQNPLNQFYHMSPQYLPICGISVPFQANMYVPSLVFKINFSFVCSYRSRGGEGWPIISMLDVLFSWIVFIHLSLHGSTAKVLGCPVPKWKLNLLYVIK